MINKYPPAKKSTPCVFIAAAFVAAFLFFFSAASAQAAEWFYQSNLLPPPNGMYNCPYSWFTVYNVNQNFVVIRNFNSRQFTQSIVPPPLGGHVIHTFASTIELEISFDSGVTFSPYTAVADNTMFITHSSDNDTEQIYDTEILQLDIAGGNLPYGVRIRESPTLSSTDQIHINPLTGGYMIDSSFYIYTEYSFDNGITWWPSTSPGKLELLVDPQTVLPMNSQSRLLLPPLSCYVTPAASQQIYANGVVIKDLKHKLFTASIEPPPPGTTVNHTFDLSVDFQLSTDNGLTFSPVRALGQATAKIALTSDINDRKIYDTEMMQLDISGGELPANIRIRESPTFPSRGGISIKSGGGGGGGTSISSFFDIFTEATIDNGIVWEPSSTAPAHVEAKAAAEVYLFSEPNLPPSNGEYLDKGGLVAFYQLGSGIVITNFHLINFAQSFPPPAPGGNSSNSFGAIAEMMVSIDGGITFSPTVALASVNMFIESSQDSGDARYFNTEILQLDVTGGFFPSGWRIRESPALHSFGRSSERLTGRGYNIESFFDIYTELSIDGGQNWYPTLRTPATIYLRSVPCRKCGDFDNNGFVDILDIQAFLQKWLWLEVVGQPATWADLDCDSKVDFRDFALLAKYWLEGCP